MMRKFKKSSSVFKFQDFSIKQKKLLNWWRDGSPYADYDIIITDGAIRSGKTIACVCSFLQWSIENFKGQDFIIAGKTIGALKRNVVNPIKKILRSWGIPFEHNRSENYLSIGSNTYYLFGASTEASQDVIQGLTAAGAFGDEAALFPRSFLEQMIGRCSIDGAKIFLNCNPLGPNHYFKKEYIDKAEEKKIYHLHFTMDDNLSLSERVKERYKRMFSGIFYMRYILGLWVLAEGLIYDMFDKDKHVIDKPLDTYKRYYVAIDYGTQNPMVFLLFGECDDGVWHVIKEYYYSGREKSRQKTDEEYCVDLINFINDIAVRGIVIDPSAASFIATMRKHGLKPIKADNSVLDGIRRNSSQLESGLLRVCKNCEHTIDELLSYSWDSKATDKGEDKPLKENDHAMDAWRYFTNTILFRTKAQTMSRKGLGI